MIVFLLLVIIVILLFGAAAVRSAIGTAIGLVALMVALAFGIEMLKQVPAWAWWMLGAVGLGLVFWMVREADRQAQLQRELAEAKREYDKATRRYEAASRGELPPGWMGAPSTTKFYNDGGNKRSRKRATRKLD